MPPESATHRSDDWNEYKMVYNEPHRQIEPAEKERAVVAGALESLVRAGILANTTYDETLFVAMRAAVREQFEIPWTAITPRMQRFIYAVNAISRPRTMIAAGIFCGNTFISNAGAAVGPGKCYHARHLIGLEIKPDEAARAQRNVSRIDGDGTAQIIAADAVEFVAAFPEPIDLLYLDADGDKGRGKGIYLQITEAAYQRLRPGSLILAHNSVNAAKRLEHYLAAVRDPKRFRASVNIVIDGEGLEVSAR